MAALKNKGGRSCCGTVLACFGAALSALWLLNPQMGVFVEIPDNLPIIGNLDEAFFTMLFLGCLSYLGFEIPFISSRYGVSRKKPPKNGGRLDEKE